jgi:hypothetical protein
MVLNLGTVHAQQAQPQAAPSNGPQFILGSGLGFKPYQTSIKDGSSGFVQGGVRLSDAVGIYTFARVVMHPTYAELIIEPCKVGIASGRYTLFLCGGLGVGANSDNVGMTVDGGGKLAYDVSGTRVGKHTLGEHTWLMIEVGVAKSTVPAPVSSVGTTISPVQPDFRVGIFKSF